MPLIRCADAAFDYEGKIVLSGLNFEINAGDYLCIVGENGSGKSTLIKGLLKLKNPCRGNICIDGVKTNETGYLPQQTEVQKDFPANVSEVVLSGRLNTGYIKMFYSKTDKEIAKQNMERLGIQDLKKRCYRDLSGGQQQRVLLARALCAADKLLILDEPAAGLDPIATQELYGMIENINKELKITVVMISHDICCAIKYAKTILHLQNEQLFFGTASSYFESDLGNTLGGCRKCSALSKV